MERIIAPKVDLQTVEIEIVRWYRREGDHVAKGELLLEITTEKASLDIEAPATGVLQGVACGEGQRVKVGETLAFIAAEGEGASPKPARAPVPDPVVNRNPVESRSGSLPSIRSTPAARQACMQHAMTVEEVFRAIGHEPVSERDVLQFVASRGQRGAGGAVSDELPFEVIPLSSRRKIISGRVSDSVRKIPHIHLFGEMNVELLEERKVQLAAAGTQVTLTDLFVTILGDLLVEMPGFNATFDDSGTEPVVRRHHAVNLGIAVSTDQGIAVPVLRDVARKPLAQIVREKEGLVIRARENRLTPQDIRDATFTLTNLGMFGVRSFTAVINLPEVAILSMGAVRERLTLKGGSPVTVREMSVCLGLDHRVLDGADGAKFLDRLRRMVEDPAGAGTQG